MGCDIHFVIERRYQTEEGQKWVGVAVHNRLPSGEHVSPLLQLEGEPEGRSRGWQMSDRRALLSERNYAFFTKLAGVRGDGPAPNGLPPDASELSRAEAERSGDEFGYHSFSHLPFEEFCARYVESRGGRFNQIDRIYLTGVADHAFDNLRVIFWFDS